MPAADGPAAATMLVAEDTGRFRAYVDLYLNMLNMQLTYDALRIIGFDMPLMGSLGGEMNSCATWPTPARSPKACSSPEKRHER